MAERTTRRDRFSTAEWGRRNDRLGRLIRHARPAAPFAVGTLAVPVIEPAFEAPLMTTVGSTALLAPGFRAATRTAVTARTAVRPLDLLRIREREFESEAWVPRVLSNFIPSG
jgi:hypothetical protein